MKTKMNTLLCRQTENSTEKCVAIEEIARAATRRYSAQQ